MKVDNTYLSIYKPNALFGNLGKLTAIAKPLTQNAVDHVEINFSALLKSRRLSLSQAQQNEKVKNVEAPQSIQKPDASISDEKWDILVKIAEAKGITDPEAIASMKLSDIGESRTVQGQPLQAMKAFLPERKAGESVEDAITNSGMTVKELFSGWGTTYYTADTIMYDAKLSDADVSTLTALYEGIESKDIEKINNSVSQILKNGAIRTTVQTGQVYTSPVDEATTLEYFAKGAALTNDPEQDRFKVGLLSELEDILGGNIDDLTLNDLGKYIDQFKNSSITEINGISTASKGLDAKLTELDRYSLYCIVEGIKQNNGSLFNEGLIDRI